MAALMRRLAPVLGLLAIAGCDLFKPADPEPPSSSGIAAVYTSPNRALVTIAEAISDKGRTNGQSAYIEAFADTANDGVGFHAIFDPVTVVRMEAIPVTVPPDWNRGLEETFYSRLVTLPQVPASAEYVVQWVVDQTQGNDDSTATAATLHREYRVLATLTETDFGYIARGFVTLTFAKISTTRWAITRWEDREKSDAERENGEISLGERRLEP